MRWENLRLVDAEATEPPLIERRAVARTFDTPEFRGITFYEIQARSIINRVPEASRVPFRWTINPYRGCSHACTYCLAGDTPILTADGRTTPLAELRVGDAIYGTIRRGNYRRYTITQVLAHWSTVKPAYRITLQDGTQLIASGDHRFLSDRGWKYVTGRDHGRLRRPHLTLGNSLMGTRKPDVEGLPVESDAQLDVASIEPLGVELPMYDITTGTGDFIADGVVSHNCFARNTHTYLDLDFGADFDSKIVVKTNAVELLRRELASPRWRGEHIAMGTNVDCYQRGEGRYRLMPGILGALRDHANPFSILTKGSLILRDLDVLREAAEVAEVSTNVSVGITDRDLWRALEPGTPPPRRRLEVCHALNNAGLACGVLMAPIVPHLTDSPKQLEATVKQIAEAGATHVSPIVLHLRTGAREWFMGWLGEHHPELVPRYHELYGRSAYAAKAYQQQISDRVQELAQRYGVGRTHPGDTRRIAPPPASPTPSSPPQQSEPSQLTLL